GNEYTGFEGAVTYMSGFVIVHRYAYVLLPLDGEPSIVFPREATYVGEHGTTWIDDQVFVDKPGEWLAERLRGKRVGVYGLDYVMTVRDYAVLALSTDLVPWDVQFDHARAVKSEAELESVRDSVRINTDGFHAFREAYTPGRTAAEVMAPAEELFVERGCGRLTMNMVLVGAEFALARDDVVLGEFCIPSLEIAGPGGHWVEVSRALGRPGAEEQRMLEAYVEYFDAAREAMRPGASAHDVHAAVSRGFRARGYDLGHVTGHSIGMTMIEHPKIGEAVLVVLVVGGGAAAYAIDRAHSDTLAHGTRIAGIDVGGLSAGEAEALIHRRIVRRLGRPLVVVHGQRRYTLTPAEARLRVDVAEMVGAALDRSRSGNFVARVYREATDARVETRVRLRARYSDAAVRAFVARIARSVDRPAFSAKVIPSTTSLVTVRSRNGLAVYQRGLVRVLEDRLVHTGRRRVVDLPT